MEYLRPQEYATETLKIMEIEIKEILQLRRKVQFYRLIGKIKEHIDPKYISVVEEMETLFKELNHED